MTAGNSVGILAWVPVLAAFGGAAGSILGQWLSDRRKVAHERRSVAFALMGEISATLDMIEFRQYAAIAEERAAKLEGGENLPMPRLVEPSEKPIEGYPVFSKNVDKIGVLGPESAEAVANLYTRLIGLRVTFNDMARGRFDALAPEAKARILRIEVGLYREIEKAGREVISALRRA